MVKITTCEYCKKPLLSEEHPCNERIVDVLTNVAQLLDGWHVDTAWSKWDEEVRKQVSIILQICKRET